MTGRSDDRPITEQRFPRNLRTAQSAAGLSNRELAQRLEVSESQLGKWKYGKVMPRWSTVLRIADALDRTPEWFGQDHDERPVAA